MVLGFIWALIWLKSFKDNPRDQKNISAKELEMIEQNQATATTMSSNLPLSYFLKHPTFISIAIAFFAVNYILYFFLTWFPSYLVDARHLSIKSMSIVSVIPWLIGLIGQMSGGFISDFIYSKTNKLLFSRKIVIVTSLLLSAVGVGLCGLANTTIMAVILMTIGVFFMYIPIANIWAIIQDMVPKDKVGATGGFVHFISNISGIIGPSVTGIIVLSTGHYTSAFLLAGILAVLGACGVAFTVRQKQQA
jgi:ACS family hexuronate transporter-like MFS transporter